MTKELRAMSDVNWIKEIFESWWLLLKHFTSLLPLKQQVLHHSVSSFYPWSDKLEKFSVLCWTFFGLYISQEKSGKRKAFLTMLSICSMSIHCTRQNVVKPYSFGAFNLEFVIIWIKCNCFVVFELSVV